MTKTAKETKTKPAKVQNNQHTDLELHTIGWKSFQDLCAHICETTLNVPISVYREANDGGQDATFLLPSNGKKKSKVGTVQCKHVQDPNRRMGVSDLTPEVSKIGRLVKAGQADTYIFISNMGIDAPIAVKMRKKLEDLGVKHAHIWGKEKLVSVIRSSAQLRALVPQVYGLGDLSTIIDERAVEQTREMLGHWLPKLQSYVATAPHNKAVRALKEHSSVLLLGNPSTGKSTIGAILSTIASEDCSHTVLQLDSPKAFERHWNPKDKNRFFWIEDAFGSNVLREDYVNDWCSLFSKVQNAIELGNKFLFTSRRHIYNAAKPKLGKRNLTAFATDEATVDVGGLTEFEKQQILYNHINFGNQSKEWKKAAKPHLEAVAKTGTFLPGIAERLGNPTFTKNLVLNESAIVEFMAEPQSHLIETIEELEKSMKAALILVFASQGRLPAFIPDKEIVLAIEDATGIKYSQISEVIPALEGSFLRKSRRNDGEEVWEFEHPTISDALTKILGKDPQMLAALLRGISISKVLADFVCHGMKKVRDTVIVPLELNDVLVERLLTVPDEFWPNSRLFEFLANRANNDVFQKAIASDSTILAREMWSWGDVCHHPKFRVHARASALGILPKAYQEETALLLEEAALENLDLTFIEENDLLSFIPPRDLFALGAKVRMLLDTDIEGKISDLGSDVDIDDDAERVFETVSDGLRIFEDVTGLFDGDDPACLKAREAIGYEIEQIQGRQEETKQGNETIKSDWISEEIQFSEPPSSNTAGDQQIAERSVFEDIDR